MRRVLILFAHPVLERSRVNRRLLEAVKDLDGVTIQDLYEAYPTLAIDVQREQDLLLAHDVIVFQHPFYWYSVPAILKEWQDRCWSTAGRTARAVTTCAARSRST
jgi:glutathione-regulated potassium-efflux system ancillary protein KefG